MTRKEAERQTRQMDTLMSLGFTRDEAEQLRRISMTLRSWHELECGDSNDYASWAIERDDNGDGPPYMVRHLHYPPRTFRTRIADRETGARKRLAAIVAARNTRMWDTELSHTMKQDTLTTYVQIDPRGAPRSTSCVLAMCQTAAIHRPTTTVVCASTEESLCLQISTKSPVH